MTVRALEKKEIPAAALTLALSFDDDPLFRHLLPEPRSRLRWLRWLHATALGESIGVGGAFTVGPDKGAIGLYPAGTWPRSLWHTIAAAPVPPGLPPTRLLSPGLALEGQIRKLHPPGEHVYVQVLGVHPDAKGKGLGGELLRHALALGKEAGVVTHLETSNEVNLPFYRRFGFETREELNAHDGPPVWTLTTPS